MAHKHPADSATPPDGTRKGLNAIHGHHIVMKEGGGASGDAARKILKDYDIPLLDTKEALKTTDPDDIQNICYAINGFKGIHSDRYSEAVLKRLKNAVGQPGTFEQIQGRLKKALKDMADVMENGRTFW